MGGPRGYYAKWNNTNTIWFYLYGEPKEQNKQNRNRLIDTEDKLTVARGEGVGELGK